MARWPVYWAFVAVVVVVAWGLIALTYLRHRILRAGRVPCPLCREPAHQGAVVCPHCTQDLRVEPTRYAREALLRAFDDALSRDLTKRRIHAAVIIILAILIAASPLLFGQANPGASPPQRQ